MTAPDRDGASWRAAAAAANVSQMRELIGERVLVTLDDRAERAGWPGTALTGLLVEVEDDGGCEVLTDDRGRFYGWPCLKVERLPGGAAGGERS